MLDRAFVIGCRYRLLAPLRIEVALELLINVPLNLPSGHTRDTNIVI